MKTPMTKIGKRLVSLLLTAVMLVTVWQVPVQAETTEQQIKAQGASPANPVHHGTKKDDGTHTTDRRYVYFSSYSQTEVTRHLDKDYMKAYYEILDMFYYKIRAGWNEDDDVSYLWKWGYRPKTLSEAGYCFKDLDGNGIPELMVSSPETDEMFWDLYTYIDGKVVHLVSSGERYRYYLCRDNTIYYESSGGASLSSSAIYHFDSKRRSLVLNEVVRYDSGTWYYGTETCSDGDYGYNENKMTIITDEKAMEIENKFMDKVVSLDLTLFDTYTPNEEGKQKKSIAVFTTEKSMGIKTGKSMWMGFGLLDENSGLLDDKWKKMSVVVSDPTVIALSDYTETEYGYSLEVIGKKQGATNITITDTESGISTIVTAFVQDDYVNTYSYAINDIASFYPNNNFEKNIETEHEKMFTEQGIKIKACIAKLK